MTDIRGAFEKVRDLKPDLVVCEVPMGIEARQQLKRILPQVAVILFTAYEFLLKGFYAAESGVHAVVAKDFGVSSLGKAVTRLFAQSGEPPDATRSRPSGNL